MTFLKAFSFVVFACLLASTVQLSTGVQTGFSAVTDVEARRGGRGGHHRGRGGRGGHHGARHRSAHRSARHHHHHHRRHAIGTALVVGAILASLPRDCSPYRRDYYYCDGYYYRPRYEGTTVVYVVVEKP
jgi:hypothetical protein